MSGDNTCKICDSPATPFGNATVLGKHDVAYFRCGRCGFIQTEEPYWLSEAYSAAIVFSDLGLVGRNLQFSRTTRAVINLLFDARGRFLDYGGGYGLFVRLMRDQGFDFYRYDPWCQNLFAQGFDREAGTTREFELVTALEVLEHLRQPLDEVRQMLRCSDSILFSTLLVPPSAPRPGQWWYYALEGGQHISLFTREALAQLATRLGLHLASRHELHLLTTKGRAARLFRYVCRRQVTRLLNACWPQRKSLLAHDYQQLTGRGRS